MNKAYVQICVLLLIAVQIFFLHTNTTILAYDDSSFLVSSYNCVAISLTNLRIIFPDAVVGNLSTK